MSLLTGKVSNFLKIGVAAAGRGDLETVRAVLAERPDWLLRVGSHGRTMLWEAAYRGRLAMVDLLLNQGADVHAWGCHFTPLLVDISPYCAARAGFAEIVSLLLEHGAEVDLQDREGHTPLMAALRSTIKNKDKLREVVRVLTEAGADLDE